MAGNPYATQKLIWPNIIFFAVTTLAALIGCPLYGMHHPVSGLVIGLFVFYMAATGLSITAGYHRLFAHAAFKAHPVMRFLFLFFGAAAFEQSALAWAAQHRDHHRYVDTDQDPYSIKKGFFYAHIGWLIFWEHKINYDNVKELQQDSLVMHQHRHYLGWASLSGIVLPVAVGALYGQALSAFLFSVCLRLTLVYHATFCINSVCHMFGKSTYDIYATAKDYWLVALMTYGEGYHNFHHRFPSDYRNGVLWYHWDPSKWLIHLLSQLRLTWDLKRVSPFRILEARILGENKRALDALQRAPRPDTGGKTHDLLLSHYEHVKRQLFHWENTARDYQTLMGTQMTLRSKNLKRDALGKLQKARAGFKQAQTRWIEFIKLHQIQIQ